MSLSTETSILNDEIQNLHFDDATSQHSLEGWKEKIAKINKFNGIDKYKVVFIGRPGSGKTTAICNWLDLIYVENNQDPKKSHDLLATGSGNTTVAEVHIRQILDGLSRIRIEYLSDEAQKEYIKDYINYYYCTCKEIADEGDDEDESQPVRHTEIDRIIRNMAKLDLIPMKTEKEGWEVVSSKVKRFETLAEFQKEILGRIDLTNRKIPEISFAGGNFNEWLYNTFKDINFGRNSKCSIPKCIYLDININDLDMKFPEYVEEIIDTLGLDTEASARLDLQKFMNQEDTICILVDEINNPPSVNLRNVIKNSFVAGSEYLKDKVALYIRLKDGELENVPDADGDADKGLKLKQDSLNTCVKNYNIPYKIENTKFMNSKEAYLIDTKTTFKEDKKIKEQILNYNVEIAINQRQEIYCWLNQIIRNLKEKLSKDSSSVQAEVEKLIEAQKLGDKKRIEKALQEIKSKIEADTNNWQVRFIYTDVSHKMANTLDNIHWATIRAMNRRYGGYETYRIDVYTEFMQAGKNEFTTKAESLKKSLVPLFKSDDKDVQLIIDGYVQRIENLFSTSIGNFGDRLLDWLLEHSEMYPRTDTNAFWPNIQNITGNGYKRRVVGTYETSLENKRFDIEAMFNQEFNDIVNAVKSWLP